MADPGCTGELAARCVPAGRVQAQDCFAEFRLETPLPEAIPPPRLTCVDGDPTCDADDVVGQCTFRVGICLNNTDSRLPCTPDAISSVILKGRYAMSDAGRMLLQEIAALASHDETSTTAHEVVFDHFFAEANRCTPFDEFVVRRGRKRGGNVLRAVVTTRAAGKDRNRLKFLCLAP